MNIDFNQCPVVMKNTIYLITKALHHTACAADKMADMQTEETEGAPERTNR